MARAKVLDIPPPIQGVSDDFAFMDQPPLTCRKAFNARGLDPKTGRRRVAQRSALAKYVVPDATMNGANKVGDLGQITKDEDLLVYADDDTSSSSGPSNVFAKTLPGPTAGGAGSEQEADCVDMRMDDFGDLYVAQRVSGVFKYNQDGELLAEILLPDSDTGGRVEIICIDLDEFGNCLVGTGGGTAAVADCRLYFFENQTDGTYRLAWTLDSGHAFYDCAFYQGTIYTLEAEDVPGSMATKTAYFKVYPDYTLIEAPTENTDKQVDLTTATGQVNTFGTRMAVRDDGVVYVTGCDTNTTASGGGSIITWVGKINPNGDDPTDFVGGTWVADCVTDDKGGLGYGVAMGPKNSLGQYTIYTYGPYGRAATNQKEVRRIVDTGTAPSFAGTNAWEQDLTLPSANPQTKKFIRMATDVDGHLYICPPTTSGNDVEVLKALDGTVLNSFTETLADALAGGTSVAVTQDAKPKGSSSEEVEFVYYGTREAQGDKEAFFKQRMLKVTQGSGSMRSLVVLGVSGGDIVKVSDTGFSDPVGATGVGALDSGAPYVQSTNLGLYRYFTDGKQYKKYSVDDDAVEDWLSETSGQIPPRCRLIETWRGRLVLGRDPEDPQLWHMSAVGLANDWDNFPAVASLTQAISGINAKAGRVPDIVNTIIPWDDDLCLFGGDKSIWRLTGDPLAGGQFDQVSLETGIAFGRCWTLDPIGGRLFFFGSRGGVYMMERNSLPVRISRDRIERRLQDVDLDTTYIRMVWNYRDEGLHVFQLPFGAGGTQLEHWFWDAKQDGWWPDKYGTTSATEVQPTAVLLMDGDAQADRRILLGGEDGRVRVWDEDQVADEGASEDLAVNFEVVYGPLMPGNREREYSFSKLTAVLASDQSGAGYRVYASDFADKLGLPVARGSFQPGRNNGEAARWRGPNAFISISNTRSGQRCAIEDLQVTVSERGRVRRRG